MLNLTRKLTLALLVAGLLSSCNKDDTTPPEITILGANPLNTDVLATYTDPGATAEDDEDGDITSSIVVENYVNNKIPGSYEVIYSATDAAGNQESAIRTVNVVATTAALAKTYSVVDTCTSGGVPAVYTYSQTIDDSTSSVITFNKFGDYSGNTGVYATLNANGTLTIPNILANNIGSSADDHRFSGNIVWTETGILVTYTDENITTSSIATCRARFTR